MADRTLRDEKVSKLAELMIKHSAEIHGRDRGEGRRQLSFFDMEDAPPLDSGIDAAIADLYARRVEDIVPFKLQQLAWEKELMGVYLSGHPLEVKLKGIFIERTEMPFAEGFAFMEMPLNDEQYVRLAAWVSQRSRFSAGEMSDDIPLVTIQELREIAKHLKEAESNENDYDEDDAVEDDE